VWKVLMDRCLITLQEIPEGHLYSRHGLARLSPRLKNLRLFPYSAERQQQEALARTTKMSIQGIQPKLSARLDISRETFEIVEQRGTYILKPSHLFYPELPANEALTMTLASQVGLEIPLHGLIKCSDGSLTYFIKRYDRKGHDARISVEDFAQLTEETRETKYNSSMEKVAKVIDRFCSYPQVEKKKLFDRILFSYLIGNEDMHLKNFSLIVRKGKVELSPADDLLNTSIALPSSHEEMALPMGGKKNKLDLQDFRNYGHLTLMLPDKIVDGCLLKLKENLPILLNTIQISFLSENMKKKYLILLNRCAEKLQIS